MANERLVVPKRWQDILDEVRAAQRPVMEKGYPVWYRGQSNSAWFARSGIHRHIMNCFAAVNISHEQSWTFDLLRDVYATLYFKFKGRARRFLNQSEDLLGESSSQCSITDYRHFSLIGPKVLRVPYILLNREGIRKVTLLFIFLIRNF